MAPGWILGIYERALSRMAHTHTHREKSEIIFFFILPPKHHDIDYSKL